MWGMVLWFAFACALEPARIGVAALLVALPRPFVNLAAFWIGLWASGSALAMAGLFFLQDEIGPIMTAVRSFTSSPAVPPIRIASGVLALMIVAALIVRTRVRPPVLAPVPVPIGGPVELELNPKKPSLLSMLKPLSPAWTALLEKGSVGMALIAGLATAAPPIEFWGAILAILASGAAAPTQVSATIVFMLVGYAVAEIPLVCLLAAPARTRAFMSQLNGWLRTYRRPIWLSFIGVFGVVMIVGGVSG